MSIVVICGATPQIGRNEGKYMNYYVLRPDLTPYDGMIVTKDSKLTFKNKNVKQKLENLKLTTTKKIKEEKFISESKLTLFLEEGDVLLFEKEDRGWFLPAQSIGTIETAINDYKGLAEALDGKEYISK